jgi:flagellar protein FliS
MLATQKIQVYRQNQVLQASPVELVVMLYDKAILNLKAARTCLSEGDLKEKGKLICQAVDIIAELQAVLDREKGGEIAVKLNQLYSYMLERLTVGHYENDPGQIAEVVRLLEELQQGWRGLAQSAAAAQAGQVARANVA